MTRRIEERETSVGEHGLRITDYGLRITDYASRPKLPRPAPAIATAILLCLANGSFGESPSAATEAEEAILQAETVDLISQTMVAIQRDLLEHYVSRGNAIPLEIHHYLGLNSAARGDWGSARKWFREAAEAKGRSGQKAKMWLSVAEHDPSENGEAVRLRWKAMVEGEVDTLKLQLCQALAEIDAPDRFGRPEVADEELDEKGRFVLAVHQRDYQQARKHLTTALLDRPDDVLSLGEVEFTDRTVQLDLPLYDPTLLKWRARLEWLEILERHKDGPTWVRLRCLRGLGRLDEAADLAADRGADDLALAREKGAVYVALGEPGRAADAWKPFRNTPDLETIYRLAKTAADLGWEPSYWLERTQAALTRLRDAPENQSLSQARFDDRYRPWLWLLAWLRLREASSLDDRADVFQAVMDRALQTLELAYKRTERHSLRRHKRLHLAQAGYLYYQAHRLDDLLYYPYDDKMLPKEFACEAVRTYASRLQAVMKLENPQLTEKIVVPVTHQSREALLFGDAAVQPGGAGPTGAPARPPTARRNPLFLVAVFIGLILLGLAGVALRNRRPAGKSQEGDAP